MAVVCSHQPQLRHAGQLRASDDDVIQHGYVNQAQGAFECAGQHSTACDGVGLPLG